MKTQRRHELQTNVLADYLGKQIQSVRPHVKTIAIGVIAVLVAVVGFMYISQQQRVRAGKAWADYFQAIGNRDVKQLAEVAQLHGGTEAGLWSRQATADLKLAQGSGEMFTDRKQAQKSLREAEENYLAIEKEASGYPLLMERASFGLAQVYEAFCDLSKAQKYYEKVAKANPDSALAKSARHRAEQLADKSTESWYNWFDRQTPVARRTAPPGKEEPKAPGDIESLPEKPDLKLPSDDLSTESQKPGEAKPAEKPQPVPPSDASGKQDPKPEPAAPAVKEQPAPAAGTAPAGEAKPAAVPAAEQPAEKKEAP